MTNLTHRARLRSGAGLDRVEWLLPLVVVSGLTFLCLLLLLAVLVYWRWVQQHQVLSPELTVQEAAKTVASLIVSP